MGGEVADSMKAAAAQTGIPIEQVKLAKELGCKAFAGTRVRLKPLREFVSTEAFKEALASASESCNWDERRKRAQALREEHRLSVDLGKSWDSAAVMEYWGADRQVVVQEMRRFLESELPPLAEGKSAKQVQAIARKFCDRLIATLEKRTAEMAKTISAAVHHEEEEE